MTPDDTSVITARLSSTMEEAHSIATVAGHVDPVVPYLFSSVFPALGSMAYSSYPQLMVDQTNLAIKDVITLSNKRFQILLVDFCPRHAFCI